MLAFFDRRWWLSLLANMASAVLLAGVSNLFLFLVPDQGASLKTSSDEISGPVIGAIWSVLFAGLGAARWLLASSDEPQSKPLALWPLLLALFCAAYPFYTLALRSTTLILIGNVLTIIAAVFVSWRVAAASRWSAVLTALLTFA